MKGFKKNLFFIFCIFSNFLIAETVSQQELLEMYKDGFITKEDYEILKADVGESGSLSIDGDYLYELRVNSETVSRTYKAIFKNEKSYFPLKEFFDAIGFKNYKFMDKDQRVEFYLGDSLEKIEINKRKVERESGNNIDLKESDILYEDNDIYLSADIFKSIFLTNYKEDNESYKLYFYTNFATPEDLKIKLDRTKEKLEEKKEENTLLYTNKGKMFELGYLRTEFNQVFKKDKDSGNDKFKKDWEASFEYQGALLGGQLVTEYDVKDEKFNDVTLRYDEIWEKHTLELGNYSAGNGYAREWGMSFKKDKGYVLTSDKTYIIRENVPIGSRVELLYLGVPIDVQDAENGVVTFENSEIKGDREYLLKIYQPDGTITFKKINTTSDYNQQNKGQIEYDIDMREDHDSGKVKVDSSIYYGLTNNLTVGLGYRREIEEINDKYQYLDTGKVELVYSNFIFRNPYVLSVEDNRVFNDIYDESNNKNVKDKNNQIYKGQLDIGKLRLKGEYETKDKYYDEKNRVNYSVEYRPFSGLELEYERETTGYYNSDNGKALDEVFSASYSKSYKNFLFSGEYEKSLKDDETYSANIYYSGFRTFTTKWENKWSNNGQDYETAFTIFNSSNRVMDYTVEFRYSEKEKDMLTFRFNFKYDNWFNFESFVDKKGNQEYKVGLDRITDLKNPKIKLDTMDSCRVKAVTFIDLNDNNICDKDEPRIDNVKVKIGGKEVKTNKKGEAMLYGIPNHVTYDLKPTIRKPSFVLGNNKIQVRGRNTSTLTAYIPVKPMLTLTGIVNIDPAITKNQQQKIIIYGDILVKVKDLKGKVIDMAVPDETGIFEISGLLPKKYIIEVTYEGESYNIKKLNSEVQMNYTDDAENMFEFNVSSNSTKISKRGKI